MSLAAAARLGDPLAHQSAMTGLLLGALVGAALAVAVVATGGAALIVAAGAVGAICAGAALGEALGSMSFGAVPAGVLAASPGSLDVRINGRPAMRAHVDMGACLNHGPQLVAQGSDSVFINALPAARQGDKLTCSASIAKGSSDVRFGGGTVTTDDIEPEVPDWVHWTLGVLGMASAVVLSGGVVLPIVGLVGGLAGSELGAWAGRRMSGAGSDGEKWGQLLGGMVGGMLGWKGGKSLLSRSSAVRKFDARLASAARQLKCRTFGGDPVDVVSGEMVLLQQDFELPALLPLVLRRFHLSGSLYGRLFGPEWSSEWDQRLEFDASAVRYIGPEGVPVEFAWPVIGQATAGLRAQDLKLMRLPHGFVVTAPGTSTFFAPTSESEARLSAVVAAQGQRIDWIYGDDGALVEVRHSGGYRLRVSSEGGRVREIRLDDVSSETEVVLMRYGYANGHLGEVINSSGQPLSYRYDDSGRLCRWQDRRGTWVTYEYDPSGRCVGTCGVADIYKERFDYDLEQRMTVHTDALGHRTTYVHNALRQVTRIVDALGGVHEWDWDEADLKLSEVDPIGRVTRYEYDDERRLTCLTRPDDSRVVYAYDAAGFCNEVTDPLGGRWSFGRDGEGRLVEAVLPDAGTFLCEYDADGHASRVIDPHGGSSRSDFDARGLLVAWSDASGAATRLERDAAGRVSVLLDAAGQRTAFAYTAEGRLVEAIGPDGMRQAWRHDAEGVLAEHADALGRVTRHETTWFDKAAALVGADGSRVAFRHDALLNLCAVTNARGESWHFTRDALGQVSTEVDSDGYQTIYQRDGAGQCASEIRQGGDPIQQAHDALGRVTRRMTSEGFSTFAYDSCGRLASACNEDVRVSFERDALGRVVKETVGEHTVLVTHDRLGRRIGRRVLAAPVLPDSDRPVTSVAAAGVAECDGGSRTLLETRWAFDPAGRVESIERATDDFMRFVHDGRGCEVERTWSAPGGCLQVTSSHDAAGRLVRQCVTGRRSREERRVQDRVWSYDRAGYLQSQADLAFGRTEFCRDACGRVLALAGARGQERYVYDAGGQIVDSDHRRPLLAAGQSNTDVIGQRRSRGSELLSAGRVSYVHDSLGRVVERRVGGTRVWRYEWSTEDRLRAVTTPTGHRWRYRYDALGRRISKERLESVSNRGSGGGSSHAERIVEAVQFVWDGDVPVCAITARPVFAKDGSEERSRRAERTILWDWLPGSFVPVSQEVVLEQGGQAISRQRFAVVTDAIGTPRELVAVDGTIAWQASTTLWGDLDEVRLSDVDCPLGFQGQYRDDESGLAYNRHRYYDPATGRYLSRDPLGLAGGMDPHGYVADPTGWTDPLGLMGCPKKNSWGGTALVRQFEGPELKDRIFSIEIETPTHRAHTAMAWLGPRWGVLDGDDVLSSFGNMRKVRAVIPLPDPHGALAYIEKGLPADRATSWGYVVDALKAGGVDIPAGRGPAYLRDLGFNMRQFAEYDPKRMLIWRLFDPFKNAGKDGPSNWLLDGDGPYKGKLFEPPDN